MQKDARAGRATIKDVARVADVSIGTVSRVLNGKASGIRISQETARRVIAAAHDLNYRKNVFASSLRGEAAAVIGLIVRDLHDPFLLAVLDALQSAAHEVDVDVLVGHADYSSDTADRQIRFMLEHWFAGLVLLGNLPDDAGLREGLTRSGVPSVAVASNHDHLLNTVDVDDVAGSELVLGHLIEHGHRDVAFVGDTSQAGVARRVETYRRFVKEARIAPRDDCVFDVPNRRGVAMSGLRSMLRSAGRPTAVFCGSDNLAMRVIEHCRDLGLLVPEDVSIAGFDDIPDAAFSFPPLTTVRQPIDQMAAAALDMLLSPDAQAGVRNVTLPPRLIVRETVSRRHGGG